MSTTTHTIDPNFKKGGTVGPIEQLELTTSNPQTVAIVDGSGDQITSFGGGTQYTEGDTDASITGTAAMMEVGSNTLQPVQGTVADGLLVNLGSNNDITGTVTAELSAVDNAVLDTIDAVLDTIKVDTEAIETAVEAMQAAQLPDGHNVTVDNASIAVTGTFWQATQPVSGTVDLGATDNAVLDQIELNQDSQSTLLTAIDADTSDIHTNSDTIAAGFAAEAAALGSGVLLQGDDGTDRKNINVDATTGDVQVDVTNTVTVDLGANNDVTVTGTVDLGATDNAVLDTIDAVLDTINAKLVTGTDIGDVTINNAAGASAVNIQDGGNTITVDGTVAVTNSDITSIKTAVEILDNAISGSEMQVDLASALPAGTNNIGDVDVLSVPRSQSGPGQPGTAVDSYTHAAINLAAGANQVLVSSAASKQIWVYGIHFVVNAAGTVSFQDEDDTAVSGIMPFAANSGMAVPPSGNFSMPIWKLGTDKDLEVDIVTSELDGWIDYAIVSV